MKARQTFNEIADEYNTHRPTYPKVLFKDIIEYAGVDPKADILEIGCGTGQATQGFIDLGYTNLTCIELGENLAEVTRKKFEHIKSTKVYNTSFEDWDAQGSQYDMAVSATAFHFIEPGFGYKKVDDLLKKNGTTAFFWTIHFASFDDVFNKIRDGYIKYAPDLNDANLPFPEEEIANRVNLMETSGTLKEIAVKEYSWVDQYSTNEYISLLDTHSGHRLLPKENKVKLFSHIKKVIEQAGGTIEKRQMVALFLAKKT